MAVDYLQFVHYFAALSTVESTILNRFRHMRGRNLVRTSQISDSARDLEDAVITAR